MALTCLVRHCSSSSSESITNYSVSSSEDGHCSAIISCLAKKISLHSDNNAGASKVVPVSSTPRSGITGSPRLVRSRAVTRDLVRDWNFDEGAVRG